MKLTTDHNPEALKRYRHIKAAPKERACGARLQAVGRICTRERGHSGPHVAHGAWRRVVAVWDSGPVSVDGPAPPSGTGVTPRRRKRKGTSPVGLASRSPVGFVDAVRGLVRKAIDSADQIAFVVLFIVFVKFAIDVLMTLH